MPAYRVWSLATRFTATGLVLVTAATPLPAQPNADLRQRLLTEAPERWQEVERFAPKVQGGVTVTLTVKIPKRNINDTDTIRYSVRQNDRCAMLRGSPVQSRRNDPVEYVFFSNSLYAGLLQREPGKSDGFLLKRHDPNPDAQLIPAPSPTREWAFVTLFPHFSYQGRRLSEMIKDSGFRIERVTTDEGGLVAATVHYDQSKANPKRKLVAEATLKFNPRRHWCLQAVQERSTFPGASGGTNSATTAFILEDHPSGIPLVRRQESVNTADSASSGPIDNRRVVEYDLRVDESVPDAEFTLSAFGLPEPVGVTWERPTPVYVWLLVAAGGLGVLAWLFRWLARRRRQAPGVT